MSVARQYHATCERADFMKQSWVERFNSTQGMLERRSTQHSLPLIVSLHLHDGWLRWSKILSQTLIQPFRKNKDVLSIPFIPLLCKKQRSTHKKLPLRVALVRMQITTTLVRMQITTVRKLSCRHDHKTVKLVIIQHENYHNNKWLQYFLHNCLNKTLKTQLYL